MVDFIDRVSSGKKIIKYENGTTETVTIENAEDATVEGTPINRENLMAIQGFVCQTITFNADGSITETNSKNERITTAYDGNGNIIVTFEGEKTITLTSHIDSSGNFSEVLQ